MPLVLIESPYAHDHAWGIALHEAYLEACLYDSLMRGESPIATHKLYTRALNDRVEHERNLGMRQAQQFLKHISGIHAVYYDLGISKGMWWGIEEGYKQNKIIVTRTLYNHELNYADRARMNDLRLKHQKGKSNGPDTDTSHTEA